MESFYPRNTVDLVANKAGAKTLVMPSDVGATPEIKDYFSLVDAVIAKLHVASRDAIHTLDCDACAARRSDLRSRSMSKGRRWWSVGEDADAARKRALLEDAGARVTQLGADDFVRRGRRRGAAGAVLGARAGARGARVGRGARARRAGVVLGRSGALGLRDAGDRGARAGAHRGVDVGRLADAGGQAARDVREAARRALRRLRAGAGAAARRCTASTSGAPISTASSSK